MRLGQRTWVCVWSALLVFSCGECGRVRSKADAGQQCESSSACDEGFTCFRGRCVEVSTFPGEEDPDGGLLGHSDGGASDSGVPDPDGGEDAGPQGTCEDPFDAGAGPFTFDPWDAGKPDGAVYIQWIQALDAGTWQPPLHSEVFLYGVVSTTPRALISGFDGGVCTFGAWVSEPSGGPSSGILLVSYSFEDGGTGPGACPDGGQLPGDLGVGEALAVHGRYEEFCVSCTVFGVVNNVAEIRVSSLERLGSAPVPPPVIVTGNEIGEGNSPAKLENNRRLEGTLVQLRNVEVDNLNPDAPAYYRNWQVKTPGGSGVDACFIHNAFDYRYRPKLGHRFKCLTGPLTFGFSHYKIEPRSDGDLVRDLN